MEFLDRLSDKSNFNRTDIINAFKENGYNISDATLGRKIKELLDNGTIIRVGRNQYCVTPNGVSRYTYNYSEFSKEIAILMTDKYPYVDFSIFELIQLNEFVNHQIAHNIVFLSVEDDVADFVFDTMKEMYPGKVLLNPSVDVFHQYWYDNMVVIVKLITEAPKGLKEKWKCRIEKILVDILADDLLVQSISESECPAVYTEVFDKYVVDESCLFRYAKRRGVEKKIRMLIKKQTDIRLRTGEKSL